MYEDKYFHYVRKWLNVQHGRAYSIVSIQIPDKPTRKRPKVWPDVHVYWELGDCSETINLDFSFDASKKGESTKAFAKVNKMMKELEKLKAAMFKAQAQTLQYVEQGRLLKDDDES